MRRVRRVRPGDARRGQLAEHARERLRQRAIVIGIGLDGDCQRVGVLVVAAERSLERNATRPVRGWMAAQDAEMQVRRSDRRIAGGTDVTDHLATSQRHAVTHALGVPVQVSIQKDEAIGGIGGVHHETTSSAVEEPHQLPVHRRDHWSATRRRNVERFVGAVAACLGVGVAQL